MTLDEKHNCTERARISYHKPVKGFDTLQIGAWEVLRQTPRGFTLMEVMIAVVILAAGLLAVLGLQFTSIRGTAFSSSLSQASVHGQEGLERLKSLPLYEADGVTLTAPFAAGLQPDSDVGVFKRQYQVEESVGYVTIRYTVSWVEKGTDHSTSFSMIKAR